VIGIEDQWAKKVADGIAATGKPVAFFGIEQHGDHDTIMRASRKAREFVQWASELERVECPLKDLWVSTKCGESDTTSGCGANPTVGNAFDKLYPHGVTLVFGETTELTGGEHLVAARCRTEPVRRKFQQVFDRYQEVVNRHKTNDLSDSSRPRATSRAASPPSRRKRSATSRRSGASAWWTASSTRRRRRADPACGSWTRPRPRPRW
jgi:(2R)-sulfolactate sulfo-lyase subunit beta